MWMLILGQYFQLRAPSGEEGGHAVASLHFCQTSSYSSCHQGIQRAHNELSSPSRFCGKQPVHLWPHAPRINSVRHFILLEFIALLWGGETGPGKKMNLLWLGIIVYPPPLNKNVSLLPLWLLGQSAAWRSAIMCCIIGGSNPSPV